MIRIALVAASICLLWHSLTASAMFMKIDEPVPVERLVANLDRFVKEHPEDAGGHYTLGRVHSLAYAKLAFGAEDAGTVEVVPAGKRQKGGEQETHPELPGFAAYASLRVGQHDQAPRLSKAARDHLEASLRHYGEAVRLAPENALYRLGHAWMLEQAGLYSAAARKPEAPAGDEEKADVAATQPSWREQALAGYRKAFELAFPQDKAREHYLSTPEALVSREAAEGVLRLLGQQECGDKADEEKQRMEQAIAQLKRIPMAITPIVFSMDPSREWGSFVDAERRTKFDLLGDGLEREWPWLKPDVGVLVWDPRRTGKIESGRQLFGSSTWWMFWENGYEALASLDDDGDSRLAGPELAGIRVWFDRDGDGQSARGEVVSLATLGITAIRTSFESHSADDLAAWNPRGIELADGRTLATWDWRPTSLEPEWRHCCQSLGLVGAAEAP